MATHQIIIEVPSELAEALLHSLRGAGIGTGNVSPRDELADVPAWCAEQARKRLALLERWQKACLETVTSGEHIEDATRRFLEQTRLENPAMQISRSRLYVWGRRYRQYGLRGLVNRPKGPKTSVRRAVKARSNRRAGDN